MDDDLSVALAHHRQGRLAQAAQIYQAVLARAPRHADALHLLGVVCLQQGQAGRAADLIGQAIAVQPDAAAYHSNLAEACRALGRHEQALTAAQAALRLDPRFVAAANNLGLAAMALGRNGDAAAAFRAAIDLAPRFAMAHNNLGNALREQGQSAEAIAAFRRALEIDPDLAEAHSNLGQMLLETQQLADALQHCREAVRLAPRFAQARNNLGNVLRETGRLAEAIACYAEALRLNPGEALTYSNMGQAVQEEGRLDDARGWYERALEIDPRSPRIHGNLASLLMAQEQPAQAQARYELALRLDPDHAELHNGLGFVLQEMGHLEEARGHYEAALRLKPDFARAHSNLGALLEVLGRLDEAETELRAALRCNPREAGAAAQLATLLRGRLPDADLAAHERLLADPAVVPAKRVGLHFGLAHVLDAHGHYADVAAHLRQANALRRAEMQRHGQDYDPAEHTRFVDTICATFTAAWFERTHGFGVDSDRPVFVVGLPRSGTTLLEQVLASHSQVFGAGELGLARDSLDALCQRDTATALAGIATVDRAAVHQVAAAHLARLQALDDRALRIVDKMPENYLYLGLLAVLFPNTRLIHVRRDLRDVAVSCWMTNFRQIRWACDPGHIGARFHDYRRVMEHWRAVLPVPLFEVSYEETVADLESVVRRLLEWCGLPWEPACLTFHETARPVRTASVAQVRQPLYTRSVARWKRYTPHLDELFRHLP